MRFEASPKQIELWRKLMRLARNDFSLVRKAVWTNYDEKTETSSLKGTMDYIIANRRPK